MNIMSPIDIRRRRALFRATHRGTKEMDWLLGRFVEAGIETWTADELDVLEVLIEESDPDLQAWVLDPALAPSSTWRDMINAIRQFHGLTNP